MDTLGHVAIMAVILAFLWFRQWKSDEKELIEKRRKLPINTEVLKKWKEEKDGEWRKKRDQLHQKRYDISANISQAEKDIISISSSGDCQKLSKAVAILDAHKLALTLTNIKIENTYSRHLT
jgi:hypothetical protein